MVRAGKIAPPDPIRRTGSTVPHHTLIEPSLQLFPQPNRVVVRFRGAAGNVGGSLIAVEFAGRVILLECGRRPGAHHFPIESFPRLDTVAAVIVSHAHHDHVGWLEEFIRRGYGGPVVCTPPTRDLIDVQFAESFRRRWRLSRENAIIAGEPDPTPVAAALPDQFVTADYGEAVELPAGARITLGDAGHLLGSATVELEWGQPPVRVFFSGDVGREDQPFFRMPPPYPSADLVISESTYGDRDVQTFADATQRLGRLVEDTAADNGRVLIPVFSLGRTHVVLASLAALRASGRLAAVPIWVDSPIAAAYSAVYLRHRRWLHPDVGDWEGPTRYATTDAESESLDHMRGPALILAAGGMCDGARARRHLRAIIDDPRCRVVLVSYQAPGTLGRRLLERGPQVRFDGRVWNKWAAVDALPGFSGHADRSELVRLLLPAGRAGSPIRLVHGDQAASQALADRLLATGCVDVAVPNVGTAIAVG